MIFTMPVDHAAAKHEGDDGRRLVVEVEHERAGNEDRRERVIEHSVNLWRHKASGHELVEGRHCGVSLLLDLGS
jgi:hypothetical protein